MNRFLGKITCGQMLLASLALNAVLIVGLFAVIARYVPAPSDDDLREIETKSTELKKMQRDTSPRFFGDLTKGD